MDKYISVPRSPPCMADPSESSREQPAQIEPRTHSRVDCRVVYCSILTGYQFLQAMLLPGQTLYLYKSTWRMRAYSILSDGGISRRLVEWAELARATPEEPRVLCRLWGSSRQSVPCHGGACSCPVQLLKRRLTSPLEKKLLKRRQGLIGNGRKDALIIAIWLKGLRNVYDTYEVAETLGYHDKIQTSETIIKTPRRIPCLRRHPGR
jgi:hypothetical protein